MKRDNFKKVIRLMSFWDIDRRKGNYRLPSGNTLSTYLISFIGDFLENNKLGIAKNGNIYDVVKYGDEPMICIPFGSNEPCDPIQQDGRIERMVSEMIGR